MKTEYYKQYSHELNREMEFKVYGHAGIPCLVFPAQNGHFYDFDNFGMIEAAKSFIDTGRIQFFCCDCIDQETWSDESQNERYRLEQHERWFHYIIDELVPQIHEISSRSNKKDADGIMTTGCSMGALHALNFFLRKPDIFNKVLAMSGIYNADFFFHGYHDELTYLNSPMNYLPNLVENHPYLELYRKADIILCCGQGAFEKEMENSLRSIEQVFEAKGIDVWIDYWGYDVSHDWFWWRRQLDYFLQFMV